MSDEQQQSQPDVELTQYDQGYLDCLDDLIDHTHQLAILASNARRYQIADAFMDFALGTTQETKSLSLMKKAYETEARARLAAGTDGAEVNSDVTDQASPTRRGRGSRPA